jgi:hypothetical protein
VKSKTCDPVNVKSNSSAVGRSSVADSYDPSGSDSQRSNSDIDDHSNEHEDGNRNANKSLAIKWKGNDKRSNYQRARNIETQTDDKHLNECVRHCEVKYDLLNAGNVDCDNDDQQTKTDSAVQEDCDTQQDNEHLNSEAKNDGIEVTSMAKDDTVNVDATVNDADIVVVSTEVENGCVNVEQSVNVESELHTDENVDSSVTSWSSDTSSCTTSDSDSDSDSDSECSCTECCESTDTSSTNSHRSTNSQQ